jgi:hypothetical protein
MEDERAMNGIGSAVVDTASLFARVSTAAADQRPSRAAQSPACWTLVRLLGFCDHAVYVACASFRPSKHLQHCTSTAD